MRRIVSALAALTIATLSAPGPAPATDQTDLLLEVALERWTGDLDGIAERGYLRVAVPHNPILISYDGEKTTGAAVERARELEKHLAETEGLTLDIVFVTLPRDEILDAVIDGRADFADANLTITEARAARVSFTDPLRENVRELVVTGPESPEIATLDDLAAVGLHLRESSSYFTHIEALNATRETPIPVVPVNENLEDRDLLEMVQAGLIPAIVVDDHKAAFWVQIFDEITVHDDLAINEGGQIAWATRHDAPRLLAALNGFVAKAKKGTLLGNIIVKRFLENADWIEKLDTKREDGNFQAVKPIVVEHAETYDFDWQMIIAQGYQESRLDQSKKSHAGAVGIMQLLPSTAKDPNVGIPDIHVSERNVEAGVKYLRFLKDRYFDEPEIEPLDRLLFALAAYNAGPGNIRKARKRAETMGLDPKVWFDNVETATAKAVSREPVIYVRNIFKYAVYLRMQQEAVAMRAEAKEDAAAE